MISLKKIESAVAGLVVGDAVGVPHEFKSRETFKISPAKDMDAFGSHNQPKGTWSDDSSLMLGLLEGLGNEYSLEKIARNFVWWRYEAAFTARGNVFDIGMTTHQSIELLKRILDNKNIAELNLLKYGGSEQDNGNGSLMRILPLTFQVYKLPIEEQWRQTWEVSALTHPPFRAGMACLIYIKIAEKLIDGFSMEDAYSTMCEEINALWKKEEFSEKEHAIFEKILSGNLKDIEEDEIHSGGYVMHTLEASAWVLLNTNSYKDAILKAVNLGSDTDTTAAVVGGLAGLIYGEDSIPMDWLESTARIGYIFELCEKFYEKLKNNGQTV